jgi:hypothetical protein
MNKGLFPINPPISVLHHEIYPGLPTLKKNWSFHGRVKAD